MPNSGEWTEERMLDLIDDAFFERTNGGGNRYLTACHVNNGAGFSYGRTLDAVVLDTYPSKGLTMHGLEVKVSASDLRRELQDTSKAGAFAPYLDYFSLACGPACGSSADIISMIPKKWGLYMPAKDGDSLRAVRKPLMLHDDKAKTFDRSFMAAFARALVARSASAVKVRKEIDVAVAEATHFLNSEVERVKRRRGELEQAIAEFEEASGVRIGTYGAGRIGEAVRVVLDGRVSSKYHIDQMRDLSASLIAACDQLEAIQDACARRAREGGDSDA